MADIGTLIMKIQADTDNFERGMTRVGTSVNNTAKIVAAATAAMAVAIGAAGVKAIQMASDAEEMQNKFDVVFSGMTDEVEAWADEYSDAVGRSKFDTMEYLANLADLQQGLGMTTEESFNLSQQIVELATDLASFNNLQDADAIDALSKALLGEAEAAKQLGLLLNVDRVKDYAEAQGLVYEELTDAERAQLTFNLAVEQSQNAIGDAERSSGSFENQMKRLKSTLSDTATEFGMTLLPAATSVVTWINDSGIPGLESFADSAKTMAQSFIDDVKPKFQEYVSELNERFGPAMAAAESWFTENMPEWKTTASDIWDGIKEGAVNYVDYLSDTYGPAMESAAEWFVEKMPEWESTAKEVWENIKGLMQPTIDTITNDLLPALDDIRVWFIETLPTFLEEAGTVFEEIGIQLGTLVTVFNETLGGAIKEEIQEFRDAWPEMQHDVQTSIFVVIALVKTLVQIVGGLLTALVVVVDFYADAWDLAQTSISGAMQLMKDDGRDFNERFIEYLTDVGDEVIDMAANFGIAEADVIAFLENIGGKMLAFAETVQNAVQTIKNALSSLAEISVDVPGISNLPSLGGDSNQSLTTTTPDYSAPYNTSVTGQNANGGPVIAGNAYLVGEKGSELFMPSQNGVIVPSGGNGITINVNGTGNPEMVANQIVRMLKMQGVKVA